jgi:hypothetical protein
MASLKSAIERRQIHHAARESSFNCMSPVVASSSSSPCRPLRSSLTRRPAPGVLRLGFGAWRIACDKNKPAAPNASKVMCAKNFSTSAKFGIMSEVSEISSGLL